MASPPDDGDSVDARMTDVRSEITAETHLFIDERRSLWQRVTVDYLSPMDMLLSGEAEVTTAEIHRRITYEIDHEPDA